MVYSRSLSTPIHVNQINIESQNYVLHIKSPFQCSITSLRLRTWPMLHGKSGKGMFLSTLNQN
jgi:hypothetical protein